MYEVDLVWSFAKLVRSELRFCWILFVLVFLYYELIMFFYVMDKNRVGFWNWPQSLDPWLIAKVHFKLVAATSILDMLASGLKYFH